MTETPSLERIPGELRDAISHYAARVREHCGDRIGCLAVYGAIAAPSFELPAGDAIGRVENVLVLKIERLSDLRPLAEEGHRFGRLRIAAPLVLTPSFVKASRDTYPLELIEIQQQHVVIVGEDVFAPLEFDASFVRLQCERQLKVISLAMRQAAVTFGADWRLFRKAAWPSLLDLRRVLRGILWLKGLRQPLSTMDMVREIEGFVGHPLPGLHRVIEADRTADWNVFELVYADIEVLGRSVDAW